MAVNFGLLNTSDVGEQFRAGMQDAQNALIRRQEQQIRAQQVAGLAEERQALAEQRRAKTQAESAEAEARRQRQEKLTQLLTQNGHRPSRELYATMAQDPDARIQAIAFQALKDLDTQEQEQAELQRLGLRGAPAPATPMAPAAEPMGAPAAPTNALAPAAAAPAAPVNAMAAPAGVTREMIQQMMLSPNANVRARGKALLDSLPKERQSQLLTPEEEAQKTRIALASRPPKVSSGSSRSSGGGGGASLVGEVGKGVVEIIDRETGEKRLVSRAEAVRLGAMSAKEGNIDAKAEAAETKRAQGQEAFSGVIDNLREAYTQLDKMRAIPSTNRGVLSNAAASLEASGVGQMASRFVGADAQRYREVVNSSRLMLLNAIKQATGMSSQQMNSNIELQNWLNAVSNPQQTIEAANDILNNIEDFVVNHQKKKTSESPPDRGGSPPTMSAEDKQALDWANANPKDPRAAAIKQRLGVR